MARSFLWAVVGAAAAATTQMADGKPEGAVQHPALDAPALPVEFHPALNLPRGGGSLTFDPRGVVTYLETFDAYGESSDPIFDRLQVTLDEQPNAFGRPWSLWGLPFVPTRFVADQTTPSGKPDPLPRWQGVDIRGDTEFFVLGDITGDGKVNTADLGILIGSFGSTNPSDVADLNGDGVVNTADLGIMIRQQGATPGSLCLYRVDEIRETTPEGNPVDLDSFLAAPAPGALVALPAAQCSTCEEFRLVPEGLTQPVYGRWTLVGEGLEETAPGTLIVEQLSAACGPIDGDFVLGNVRGETASSIPQCCFYGAFDNLGYDFVGINTLPAVVEFDAFVTSLDTFTWMQGIDATLAQTFNVLWGGVAALLDPAFFRITDEDGYLGYFTFRRPTPDLAPGFRFYATAPDPDVGAIGKRVLVGEWFTMRIKIRGFSRIEVWVRDSETAALADPMPGDDSDGVTDDGFARLLPSGPYGPAIEAATFGAVAPDPFEMGTSTLRQIQWLWGGDQEEAVGGGEFRASNWFIDNLMVTSR